MVNKFLYQQTPLKKLLITLDEYLTKMIDLDTITVDVVNNHTDLSFSNYQFRFNDKEMHMVTITNPKYLEFELVVISVFSIFTLVNKIETFVSCTPEAALCTDALFSDVLQLFFQLQCSL